MLAIKYKPRYVDDDGRYVECDLAIKRCRLTPLDRRMPAPGFPKLPAGLSWHIYGDDSDFIGFVDNDGWIVRGVRVNEDESLVQAAQRCELRLAELTADQL